MTLEEVAERLGRSPNTIKKNFKRTQETLAKQGVSPEEGAKLIVDHAYQVATKYGEGAAAAACEASGEPRPGIAA